MDYRIDFESRAWESPMAGVRSKTWRQGGRQIRLVEYRPQMEPHWCERGHYGCILEGEFEIGFPDRIVVFRAGDGVAIPAGAAHRHRARVVSAMVRALFVEDLPDA